MKFFRLNTHVNALVLLLFITTNVIHAEVIDADKVMVLSHSELSSAHSISESDFPEQMTHNLVKQVDRAVSQGKAISLFGKTTQWQTLDKAIKESADGLHLMKLELSANQFSKGTLAVKGAKSIALFVNGIHTKGDNNQFKLQLMNADHRLYLVTDTLESWDDFSLSWNADENAGNVTFRNDTPKQRLHAKQMYDSATFTNLSMSPDGEQMVWTKREFNEANGDTAVSLTELVDVDSQKILYRWQGLTPSAISWSPDNQSILYSSGGNIYLLQRDDLTLTTVAEDVTGANNFSWLNNSTVAFSWLKRDESGTGNTKHYKALEDRWTYWRNNTQVYQLDLKSGLIAQITKGDLSHSLRDISENGSKLLVTRNPIDYSAPPHFKVELVEIDIASGEQTILATQRGSISQALYSDDGIYILAGPSFADGVGRAVSDQSEVNDYDGQLYRLSDGEIVALSKTFNPAISSFMSLANDDLLVTAVDQDRRQLFIYDESRNRFESVKNALDVVDSVSASMEKRPTLLFAGTNATLPQRLFLKQGNSRPELLMDTATEYYSNTQFSQIKEWDFTNKNGEVIDGRYYLPPDFDSNKKYPVIVYYYGGTSPVTRSFTGRWPFSLWAAQGYVVYVNQPAGTFGYGQEFSGKHVNAWGLQTADDIITSTKAFLSAHSFVDSTKVASMGASYGGFMAMYLTTKTDMFAASISHAGISNLAEYWGHGWWGYAYSGVASRGSFPWNATDFYTQQSPLFQADDITTPLLLIHGSADTNVPTSQSHQMYTALKLLGQDVEFVEFMGEDHHINSRARRLEWWNTILSYLDYKLKEQPLWWQTLYPE